MKKILVALMALLLLAVGTNAAFDYMAEEYEPGCAYFPRPGGHHSRFDRRHQPGGYGASGLFGHC